MVYNAEMDAVYRNHLPVDVARLQIVMRVKCASVGSVEMAEAKENAAVTISNVVTDSFVKMGNAELRTVAGTRTLNAAMIVSAIKVNAVSKVVAFETVVVATQVSAKIITTVVMDYCVTIKAADKHATTTNRVRKGSNARVLGLGARSVWSPNDRLFESRT